MKTMLNYLLGLMIIILSVNSFAQEDYFSVLAEQGKISLVKTGGRNWKEIQIGSRIFPGEKIRTNKGSYIALVYSEGNTLEINKASVYSFDGLKDKIYKNFKSSNKRFAEYVISEIRKKEDDAGEMKSLGAVVREKPNYIAAGIPYSTHVIDSNIVFKWYPYSNSKSYIFELYNNNGQMLYMKKLSDTLFNCPLNMFHLNKNEKYEWKVTDYNNNKISSDRNFIMIPAPDKSGAIKDSLKELKETFAGSNSAINKIILASFYQNNQLNIEALKEYKEAVRLAPDVKIYKKMLNSFLLKMKLDRMINYYNWGKQK